MEVLKMRNMNSIGNKYEITVFEWYEQLAKAEKRLEESIECNKRFGDNEEWIIEDTEKVNKAKSDVIEIKEKFSNMNIQVDFERVKQLAFNSISR